MNQIEQISNLLKTIGIYGFLNREQLIHFSEKHFGKSIGLSYIQKAVSYNLIVELQEESNYKNFYFSLNNGAFHFLDSINFKYRKLPLDCSIRDRELILAINNLLINNNYSISNEYGSGMPEPIFTKCNTVLYNQLNLETIQNQMLSNYLPEGSTMEDLYNSFKFKKMELEEVKIHNQVKGNSASNM